MSDVAHAIVFVIVFAGVLEPPKTARFVWIFYERRRFAVRPLDAAPRNKLSEQGSRLCGDLRCHMLHLSLALLGATASLRRGALVPEEADGPVERGTPGAKCWGQCGGPGSCPQFCGRPEQWSGSCCELKALGSDQPDECVNRGCIGFACCVQDCDVVLTLTLTPTRPRP